MISRAVVIVIWILELFLEHSVVYLSINYIEILLYYN